MVTINELRTFLEMFPVDRICKYGFCNPHSYRGRYDEVAFELTENVTIESMLECIEKAVSYSFTGWKGGEFYYDESTPVNFANEGYCSEDCKWENYNAVRLLLSISGVRGE